MEYENRITVQMTKEYYCKVVPRNKKSDYWKMYFEANKDILREKDRLYRLSRDDYAKQRRVCPCGSNIRADFVMRHLKTERHINRMSKLYQSDV
jgi:hypothetical protein